MSATAKRFWKRERANCRCGHRAVFFRARSRETVRVRGNHPLCGRCWRSALGRDLALQMRAAYARHLNFVPGPFALL